MESFIVRMTFDESERAEIAEMLLSLTEASRREPGCVSYIPHFVEGDPCTVVIYEQWTDAAGLEFHRGTPHFHQYAIGGLYQKMKDRHIENLTAIS